MDYRYLLFSCRALELLGGEWAIWVSMVRCLRFFTAVGDTHHAASKWNEEELHSVSELERAKQPATGLTFQDALKRLFSSEKFQVLGTK